MGVDDVGSARAIEQRSEHLAGVQVERRRVDAGDDPRRLDVGVGILRRARRPEDALEVCVEALAAGCDGLRLDLAELHLEQGRDDEARAVLPERPGPDVWFAWLRLLATLDPHRAVAESRPGDGRVDARWTVVTWLLEAGERGTALALTEEALDGQALPDPLAVRALADLLVAADASTVIDRLAALGSYPAQLIVDQRRAAAADEAQLERLVAGGNRAAGEERARRLSEQGRESDLLVLAERGDHDASWALVQMLGDDLGRTEEAIGRLEHMIQKGSKWGSSTGMGRCRTGQCRSELVERLE